MREFVREIRDLVIRPSLIDLGMYSESAEILLISTALAETGFREVEQGRGPMKFDGGLGYWQMEAATYYDIFSNYIDYRKDLELKLAKTCNLARIPKAEAMIWHTKLACCMARIHYYRVSDPLPKANDIEGMARYWKAHFNTKNGKGTIKHFLEAWENR